MLSRTLSRREAARWLPVDEGARDLRVASGSWSSIQAARRDRRIRQGVADRLRVLGLLDEVAALEGPRSNARELPAFGRGDAPASVARRPKTAAPRGGNEPGG